ncbi:MAG: hypothetical protein EA422_05535, partial [Gemmatimonadales bacterium]
LGQVLGRGDVPGLLALAAWTRLEGLPQVGEGPPTATPELLDAVLRSLATGDDAVLPPGLHRCRDEASPVDATLCSLELLVPRLPARAGLELTEEANRLLVLYREAGRIEAGEGGQLLGPLQRYAEGVLEDASHRRGSLPGLADLTWGHPAVAEFRELAQAGGRGLVDDGEAVVAQYRQILSGLASTGDRVQSGFDDVEDGIRGRLAWAEERSLAYLASRSALLSGLEEGAARRLQMFGEAAADLRLEGRLFGRNVRDFGRDAAVSLLSGNVVGVAASVASFFEMTPGGVGMGAAGDVRALRDAVDELRADLEERHGLVELRLDALLDTVDDGMARLERLVESSHREVQSELMEVRRSLEGLEERLARSEATLAAYMQAGFDRDHARTLVRCLEHRSRHLPPFDRMDFGTFAGCLTEFRVRGERDARDALLADRTTPVSDEAVREAFRDLSSENLAHRLPLLARVGVDLYGYGALDRGRGVANPLEWRLAADAYLTMLDAWPEHAQGVAPGDLEALLAVGTEVEGVLKAVTGRRTSGQGAGAGPGAMAGQGTGEGTEMGVLGPVLAEYRRELDALVAEADRLATRHRQAQLRRVDPASLLNRIHSDHRGGSGAGRDPHAEGRQPLEVPEWLRNTIPPEVRTAAVLALEEPELVFRTSITYEVNRENFRRRFIFWKRHDRRTMAHGVVEVELRLDEGRSVWTHRVELPPFVRRLETMGGGEDSGSVREVRMEEPDPHGTLLRTLWPQAARGVEGWSLASPRGGLRAELDRAIADELRRYESVSLTRVFGAVCMDDGAAATGLAGLDGADLESAVRIRSALDGLSLTRAVLSAAVALGLPGALERDDELRELLTGSDGLLDRAGLCGAVAQGGSALRVVWLEEAPRERAERMGGLLAERVSLQDGPLGIPLAVERTNEELRTAIRLQRMRALAASRAESDR